MEAAEPPRSHKRDVAALVAAAALPVPWIVAHAFVGPGLAAETVAILAGLAILGGAFLITWATELAERDIPQALAILVLALVSVLPEYAVDLHFAWTAGKQPESDYVHYAVANMTGANRLLVGWAVVVLIACARSRRRELIIDPRQHLEIRFLLWATLYSFLIPLTGTIHLLDAAVLFGIFLLYAWSAARSEPEEVALAGPPAMIDREVGTRGRRVWEGVLFVYAAYAIFISAAPFADGLVEIGRLRAGVDEFLLVQWVAPLASESPEFLVATLFAWRLRGSLGIGALISSKVNQWTLLVGAIPVAFSLSAGSWRGLPLDERQTEELILTSAQSLMAVVFIVDLRFSRIEAVALAVLFLGQFAFTSTEVRYLFTALYLATTVGLLVVRGGERRAALASLVFSSPVPRRRASL
jgi:cation:H+ antiporter